MKPETKGTLKIFFAGLGTGMLLALFGFALLSAIAYGGARGSRTVTTGVWEISASTNHPVEYKRIVHQYP
jgi:hypothetical protein